MVTILDVFNELKPIKALVIGDFVLDRYTKGKVDRISPEAPVPVLHVLNQEDLPGMSGNVVLNLLAFGAAVSIIGRIGNDMEGKYLSELLTAKGADTSCLWVQDQYQTPIKQRLIADAQQLVRIDHEEVISLSSPLEAQILEHLNDQVETFDVIAISDYAKGFLSDKLLSHVIQLGNKYQIPVIIDPKGNDFSKYQGATLIKPNMLEALTAAKLSKEATLEQIGQKLLEVTSCKYLMITRSDKGISLFRKGETHCDFPVIRKEVVDVTGAGDTVLATMTVALGSGFEIERAIELSNYAASLVIERLGCVSVTFPELAKRMIDDQVENKIFDENHLFSLQQFLENKEFMILGAKASDVFDVSLLMSIQKLKRDREDLPLMLYFIDQNPPEEYLSMLSSFEGVDFIVLHTTRLKLKPTDIYLHEGKETVPLKLLEDLLSHTQRI